jgi:hypothetical protein
MVSETMSTFILVALIHTLKHHIMTLSGLSANKYQLFWEFIYPCRRYQSSSLNRINMWPISSAYFLWRYLFIKFSLASQTVLQSLWNHSCLMKMKMQHFCYILCKMMHLCRCKLCKNFLGNIPIYHKFCPLFFSQ